MSRDKGLFTQAELKRIVKAAKAADTMPVRIRYSSDGVTVEIGDPPDNSNANDNGKANPWDEVLSDADKDAKPKRPA